MSEHSLPHFQKLLKPVADEIRGTPFGKVLQDNLNRAFPPDGERFRTIERACHDGIRDGVFCRRGAEAIKFGRIIDACDELAACSVDLVYMNDVKGPFHTHPRGEIDMIMPIDTIAEFDGHGAGWLVYEPESSHSPTVTGGDALILYLLPGGEIRFHRS